MNTFNPCILKMRKPGLVKEFVLGHTAKRVAEVGWNLSPVWFWRPYFWSHERKRCCWILETEIPSRKQLYKVREWLRKERGGVRKGKKEEKTGLTAQPQGMPQPWWWVASLFASLGCVTTSEPSSYLILSHSLHISAFPQRTQNLC